MQMITSETIKSTHEKLWADAVDKYGDEFKVPHDALFTINETIRALYILQVWQRDSNTGNPAKFLNNYSVHNDVLLNVIKNFCSIEIESVSNIVVKSEKRSDKYDAFIDWTKDHLFEQYTTEQLVSISGFSYPTTLKFIQESPAFRKIKKGLWEIRDPKADREADK